MCTGFSLIRIAWLPCLVFTLFYTVLIGLSVSKVAWSQEGFGDAMADLATVYSVSISEAFYMLMGTYFCFVFYVFGIVFFLAKRKSLCQTYQLMKEFQDAMDDGGQKNVPEKSSIFFAISIILNQGAKIFC